MQQKKSILIIDDDSRNIFALSAVLKAKGFSCVSALGAKEGMSILSRNNSVGVVLLDMMMPEMDGYEAIPRLKQLKPKIPVVAVTAQAMVGDREKCLQAGADEYVAKPVDVDRMVTLLNEFLK